MRIGRLGRFHLAPLFATLLLLAPSRVAHAQSSPAFFPATRPKTGSFTNPLLRAGADPWVIQWEGFYYYSSSSGAHLALRKTPDITDLRDAAETVVWTPEPGHAWSKELWAPELHRWGKKWYIYFAADAGDNTSHRIYVIENESADPTTGTWMFKGKVADTSDKWAIDPDLFELKGEHYLLWSGWQGDTDGEQDIYIAHMSNPWTIDSPRSLISQPKYRWERHGTLPGRHVSVNEGPEALVHAGDVFVVFSASACWTDFYTLGVLQASVGANLLDPKSWKKYRHAFLKTDPQAHAFGPGHNGFFTSPDGTQDWLIYHANSGPNEGCGDLRSLRIQRFTWNADGTPHFGVPASLDEPMKRNREIDCVWIVAQIFRNTLRR